MVEESRLCPLDGRCTVLERLSTSIASSAIHDHKDRVDKGCFQGTRTEVLDTLSEWIEQPQKESRIYWVTGSVGVGKSAIAQTLCEKYYGAHIVASFFFWRTDGGSDLKHFALTIAYQLVRAMATEPDFQSAVNEALLANPHIMDVDYSQQIEQLVVKPCEIIPPERWKTLPKVLIIDEVDQCGKELADFLSIIKTLSSPTNTRPFEILLFSRPEALISDTLSTFVPPSQHLSVDGFDSDSDIEMYYRYHFSRIFNIHRQNRTITFIHDWPGDEAIAQLVRNSDQQFLYAATAIRYIESPPLPLPPNRLKTLLDVPKASFLPELGALDRLYMTILVKSVRVEDFKPILEMVLTIPRHRQTFLQDVSLCWISNVLGASIQEVSSILSHLHSVLWVPDIAQDVKFIHRSFKDFLTDSGRSGEYYIDTESPEVVKRISKMVSDAEPRVLPNQWEPCTDVQKGEIPTDICRGHEPTRQSCIPVPYTQTVPLYQRLATWFRSRYHYATVKK